MELGGMLLSMHSIRQHSRAMIHGDVLCVPRRTQLQVRYLQGRLHFRFCSATVNSSKLLVLIAVVSVINSNKLLIGAASQGHLRVVEEAIRRGAAREPEK